MKLPITLTTPSHRSHLDPRSRRRGARALLVGCALFHPTDLEIPGGDHARELQGRSAALRAFRRMSEDYLQREAPAHAARELMLFGVIVVLTAWPIALAAEALLELLRG